MPVVHCDGADLYYEDRGEGPVIVFLHGAWTGLRYFEEQLRDLSGTHRTLALDFRGHGRSEKTEAGHTVSQYARDVEAFLDALDLDAVVLVGWSLGALVTWEYADQFGTGRVRALVNVDMEPSPGRWEDGEGRYDAQRLADIHDRVQADHWSLVEDNRADLLKEPPSPAVATTMFDEDTRCPPATKSAIVLDATTRDYADVLPEIDVPSLVCAGADETWRSVAAVERSADLLADVRVEVFADSGHCPFLEEPERFDSVLEEFVDATS